jgi:peroxiredoxin
VSVKGEEKVLNKYKKEFNISSPLVIDKKAKLADTYGVWAHPTTFFINREGKIVGRAFGGKNWISKTMRNFIQSLLDKKE